MRSYRQSDGSYRIWELDSHITRLFDSAKIVGFEIPYSKKELVEACKLLQEANGEVELYFRPVAYAANAAESAKPQKLKISVDIYAFPLKALHQKEEGIDCIISSHRRGYPDYQMQAKTASNYSFLQLVKPELDKSGADEALLMDRNGHIVEATVANLFVVRNKFVITPPNDGSILPGITRQCVARIIDDYNIENFAKPIPLIEKPVTRADLYTADCVFLCGTYAEVIKVAEIDGRKIDGNDDIFQYIKKEYAKMVRNGN